MEKKKPKRGVCEDIRKMLFRCRYHCKKSSTERFPENRSRDGFWSAHNSYTHRKVVSTPTANKVHNWPFFVLPHIQLNRVKKSQNACEAFFILIFPANNTITPIVARLS